MRRAEMPHPSEKVALLRSRASAGHLAQIQAKPSRSSREDLTAGNYHGAAQTNGRPVIRLGLPTRRGHGRDLCDGMLQILSQ